jgi:hypothetical protein
MIRRLLNVAAVLSLLAAALLAIAGFAKLPEHPFWIGRPGGAMAMAVYGGRLDVVRNSGGAFVGVPLSAQLGTLAWMLILPAAVWALVNYRQDRRRRSWQAKGFPIEVSRHAPPIEPAANRGT